MDYDVALNEPSGVGEAQCGKKDHENADRA